MAIDEEIGVFSANPSLGSDKKGSQGCTGAVGAIGTGALVSLRDVPVHPPVGVSRLAPPEAVRPARLPANSS